MLLRLSYSIALIACVVLALGLILPFDNSGIWGIGLGEVGTQSLLSSGQYWPSSLVFNTILANLPQLIFSMLYFASNSMVTAMILADEWARYATQRKGLRVSCPPTGAQRRSYFLSLPYRYFIPLIVLSTLLHWLISQSLFLVGIEAYSAILERYPQYDITPCGYSLVGIVSSISVGLIMFCCLIGLSRRRFKTGMPVAGSCNLAIATARHPDPNPMEDGEALEAQTDAEYLPLQWGVIQVEGEIGHCAFSSQEVVMPEDGRVYE